MRDFFWTILYEYRKVEQFFANSSTKFNILSSRGIFFCRGSYEFFAVTDVQKIFVPKLRSLDAFPLPLSNFSIITDFSM